MQVCSMGPGCSRNQGFSFKGLSPVQLDTAFVAFVAGRVLCLHK